MRGEAQSCSAPLFLHAAYRAQSASPSRDIKRLRSYCLCGYFKHFAVIYLLDVGGGILRAVKPVYELLCDAPSPFVLVNITLYAFDYIIRCTFSIATYLQHISQNIALNHKLYKRSMSFCTILNVILMLAMQKKTPKRSFERSKRLLALRSRRVKAERRMLVLSLTFFALYVTIFRGYLCINC